MTIGWVFAMPKILVVSPSQTFRRLVERALADTPHPVVHNAANKLEALSLTFSEHPDVVVVALESWSETVDVLEAIHQRPENQKLPLVALRPHGGSFIEQMKSLSAGASLYLKMPIDPAVLGAKLCKLAEPSTK
jgi:CheY-like chemotaxis protein